MPLGRYTQIGFHSTASEILQIPAQSMHDPCPKWMEGNDQHVAAIISA